MSPGLAIFPQHNPHSKVHFILSLKFSISGTSFFTVLHRKSAMEQLIRVFGNARHERVQLQVKDIQGIQQ